jgi:N-sulfoglucosamine sulfohydrolase
MRNAGTTAAGLALAAKAEEHPTAPGILHDRRPNIIYLVCHDIGKEAGCYGKPIDTPVMNAFAAGGARFDNYFCSSPCCTPSRCCAYTGQYAHTNGVMGLANFGWSMAPETNTIVDYFNQGGYETAHCGVQHERHAAVPPPDDVALSAKANRYQVEMCRKGSDNLVENALDAAVAYLESRASDAPPFYLNVGTSEVHAGTWQIQGPKAAREWKAWRHGIYGDTPEDEVYMPPYLPGVPQLRKEMGRFQACIRYYDTQIERLFEAVKRLGLAHNTLVVCTTDHGISNMRSKGSLYDRGVEIMLLMQMQGVIPEGSVVHDLVQNIDMAPTLLEAAGLPIPETMQGQSFWPRLTGQPYEAHDMIFLERNYHSEADYDPMRAVRTSRHHYIRFYNLDYKRAWIPGDPLVMGDTYDDWFTDMGPWGSQPRSAEELYDIARDPQEFHNLASDPEYKSLRDELNTELTKWMEETQDPLLQGKIEIPGRNVLS